MAPPFFSCQMAGSVPVRDTEGNELDEGVEHRSTEGHITEVLIPISNRNNASDGFEEQKTEVLNYKEGPYTQPCDRNSRRRLQDSSLEIEADPLLQDRGEPCRADEIQPTLTLKEQSIPESCRSEGLSREWDCGATGCSYSLIGLNWFASARNQKISSVRRHSYVLFGSKTSIMLPAVIVSLVTQYFKCPKAYVFIVSLLGIAPLAERLGFVTEQLAFYTGPVVGGLLNATFGNATEMILSLFGLQSGLRRVVQLSLLGSILSNMLLVLGCAFFFGGLAHPQHDQHFNQTAAAVNSGLLLMAVMGLVFPAVLQSTHTEIHDGASEVYLSRFSSCIMLLAYGSFIFFQLRSQQQLWKLSKDEQENAEQSKEEQEEIVLGPLGSFCWLGIITLLISLLSRNLINAIEGASKTWKIPMEFVSVIVLPIVGNAAEHSSAILFAMKDKLDISVGVAIGSSTQISMFVIPFCVVYGWITRHAMDLNFHIFETSTLFITVIVVAFMLQEGRSNYFKGLMLILCYFIVAASFYVHVDNPNRG